MKGLLLFSRLAPKQSGFTLIELVLTTVLMAILATLAVPLVTGNADGYKYERTRQKMDVIRLAIFGDPSLGADGHRTKFGYFGDMGRFPAALTDLTTQGAQTAYTFDNTYGTGAGWRGPYFASEFNNEYTIDKDEWGNAFVWTTSPLPAILTSKGSDNAVGGTFYAQDLTMLFPSNSVYANVRGFVSDGSTRLQSRSVEIR